jgi:hypothetical protein
MRGRVRGRLDGLDCLVRSLACLLMIGTCACTHAHGTPTSLTKGPPHLQRGGGDTRMQVSKVTVGVIRWYSGRIEEIIKGGGLVSAGARSSRRAPLVPFWGPLPAS